MQEKVLEFHKAFGAYIGTEGARFPDNATRALRQRLINEEVREFFEGENNEDIVNVAKELADVLYVVFGTAVAYGIPLEQVFDEVHRSNMSKLGADGKPIYREDGKVLKGPNYFEPNVRKILEEA